MSTLSSGKDQRTSRPGCCNDVRRSQLLAVMVAVACSAVVQSSALATIVAGGGDQGSNATIEPQPVQELELDLTAATPVIVVGDPNGAPPITPAGRVSANVPTSAFAGVVSINSNGAAGNFIGSGTLIHPQYIVTAAHVVDVTGGLTPGNGNTGDGIVDFTPNQVAVVFNNNNPGSNLAGATVISASQITIYPNWHGFNNAGGPEGPSLNDDLAIIRLSSPAPAGVPIYPLSNDPFNVIKAIVLAGYGTTGDGVNGFQAGTANFFIKRSGQNVAGAVEFDDEAPFTAKEVYDFDFDGPTNATNTLGDGLTFGNNFEVTVGPGDSGGPSFLWNDANANSLFDQGEMTLFGVNTFSVGNFAGLPAAPLFGSQGGGMLISTYASFILQTIPEPSAAMLMLFTGLGLACMRMRRSHGSK